MYWGDRMRLGKHIPLGDLIYLDQERCIHCARCIRFQENIADDPVLGFDQRGRRQQIITGSTPGFDSIFSGNTTDICPVGALTTADFRFNARPWEMVQVATICSHCPVGCNMSFDTRTDREAGGRTTIKRVMPRQNEWVNEIWICDKGRFGHHYMEHPTRLTTPLVRQGGQLVPATWEEALTKIAAEFNAAGSSLAAIASGRLSNEDLFALQALVRGQGSSDLGVYPNDMAGGEYAAQVGVGAGANLQELGAGDAILVAASDLHEEAPVWWLRVIAAVKRGAALIVANGRETRLDQYASHVVRYSYGAEVDTLNQMADGRGKDAINAAGRVFAEAKNAVAFVGSEGLTAEASRSLVQSVGYLLTRTGHAGRANNGLIMVWPEANGQGAADMGLQPHYGPGYTPVEKPGRDYGEMLAALIDGSIKAFYIAGADPAFDDPAAESALRATKGFIVVQDMFRTATAELADVVLPAQSIAEREGTYTSGERRVQRFYPAIESVGESLPAWLITQKIAERLGHGKPSVSAAAVLAEIGKHVPSYKEITYQALAKVVDQFPDVGGNDLYYGGAAFQNTRGIGIQLPSAAEAEPDLTIAAGQPGQALAASGPDALVVVPIRIVYDAAPLLYKSALLHRRVPLPHVGLNPADAVRLGVEEGDMLRIIAGEQEITVAAYLEPGNPAGVATLPRRLQPQGAPPAAMVALMAKLEKVEA
jgi:NADH-quinone oxidoreductase subunit G